jgi:hypothetical protein
MTRIEADDLLPAQRLRDAAAEGEITQIHRGDRHAEEGDTFLIDGDEYELTEVRERRLGELTDEDARAEGSPSLKAYKKRIEETHGTTWDDDSTAFLTTSSRSVRQQQRREAEHKRRARVRAT